MNTITIEDMDMYYQGLLREIEELRATTRKRTPVQQAHIFHGAGGISWENGSDARRRES
jgi:molybdopterin synthase catalytic subunit